MQPVMLNQLYKPLRITSSAKVTRRISRAVLGFAVGIGTLLFVALAAQASVPSAAGELDCAKVCSGIRNKVKNSPRKVESEYVLWQQRLGVKSDIVRYPQGLSAAEELLRFMSTYYVTKAPDKQMDPQFLAYTMGKCFPEAYIDPDRARLSGLVDTIWAAEHLHVVRQLSTCH